MPLFDQSVGPDGQNNRHDVAALQASFSLLAQTIQPAFWDGQVDGNWRLHEKSLTDGIEMLRRYMGLSEEARSGPIEPQSPTAIFLRDMLPQSYRSLKGVKGTSAVTVVASPYPAPKGQALLDKWALPAKLQDDINSISSGFEQRTNIPFPLVRIEMLNMGEQLFRFGADGVTFLGEDMSLGSSEGPFPGPIFSIFADLVSQCKRLTLHHSAKPRPRMFLASSHSTSPAKWSMEREDERRTIREQNEPRNGDRVEIGGTEYIRLTRVDNITEEEQRRLKDEYVAKVDQLLADGLAAYNAGAPRGSYAPPPVENYDTYTVESVTYIPYDIRDIDDPPTARNTGLHVSTGFRRAKIYIFPSAFRLFAPEGPEQGIARTYAHELHHFNQGAADTESQAEAYGINVWNMIKKIEPKTKWPLGSLPAWLR